MKKILIILTILIPVLVFSQKLSDEFTVSTATPYKVIDAGSKEYISLDNGYIIMAKMGRGIVTLQKFDVNNMLETSRSTYDDLPEKAYFQDIIKLEDRVYYIYEAYNKKNKNYSVYSREINTEDAVFKEQKKLFTTKRKVVSSHRTNLLGISGVGFGASGNKFLIHKSFDNSKVMIQYRLYPLNKDDKKNYDEIGFYVFDNKMQKIWGKTVKMPYTEAQINNIAYSVSSKGTALMLIANREKKIYQAISLKKDEDLVVYDLDIPSDKFIRYMKIKEDNEGNFICGGFYANGLEFKYNFFSGGSFVFNVNGFIYLKFDNNGKVLINKAFEFSKEFIEQNLSDKQILAVEKREKEGKAGILDLVLINYEIKEDGSLIFVGEKQYYKKEFFQGPQQKIVYHFSNIVIAKIDKTGQLVWQKKLPKNQVGVNGTGQMSYAYMPSKDAVYIAFVDNPKNIELSAKDGVPSAHYDGKGGYLTTYKVNYNDGSIEKHTICDLNNINGIKAYQFKAYRIIDAGDGNFLMEIYIKNKKDTMVKFKLNN